MSEISGVGHNPIDLQALDSGTAPAAAGELDNVAALIPVNDGVDLPDASAFAPSAGSLLAAAGGPVQGLQPDDAQMLQVQAQYQQYDQAMNALRQELHANPGLSVDQAASRLGIDTSSLRPEDRQLLELHAKVNAQAGQGGGAQGVLSHDDAELLAAESRFAQSQQAVQQLLAELKADPGLTLQGAADKLGVDLSQLRSMDRELIEAQARFMNQAGSGARSTPQLPPDLLAGIMGFIRG